MRSVIAGGMVVLAVAAGCDTRVATAPAPAPVVAPVAPPVVAPPLTEPAPEPETDRVVAETGVGAKGRDYGGGIITEPVRQYFRAPQMAAFDIQIPHAMNLFKATHDRLPESHDEFMKEIIEFNQIKLPKLPPGEKYIYVPEEGQLMVERPRK